MSSVIGVKLPKPMIEIEDDTEDTRKDASEKSKQ